MPKKKTRISVQQPKMLHSDSRLLNMATVFLWKKGVKQILSAHLNGCKLKIQSQKETIKPNISRQIKRDLELAKSVLPLLEELF